eukprot:6090461-Pyramimonas_sp.AAC.1
MMGVARRTMNRTRMRRGMRMRRQNNQRNMMRKVQQEEESEQNGQMSLECISGHPVCFGAVRGPAGDLASRASWAPL